MVRRVCRGKSLSETYIGLVFPYIPQGKGREGEDDSEFPPLPPGEKEDNGHGHDCDEN